MKRNAHIGFILLCFYLGEEEEDKKDKVEDEKKEDEDIVKVKK